MRMVSSSRLAPDNSAVWVLGNAAAHIDLSAFAEVVPVTTTRRHPVPLAVAGAILVALGLAPVAWRAVAPRRPPSLSLWESGGEGFSSARTLGALEKPSPGLRRPLPEGEASCALTQGRARRWRWA